MSGPQDFWDFIDQIDDQVAEIIDDIFDAACDAADALNDAANGVLATLGRLVPGESDAEKAIKKWNNEILPAIEQGMDDIRTKVSEAVSDFVGNPGNLLDYAHQMSTAKATLYQTSTLNQEVTNLGNTWEGPAYNYYATVAGEQSDAMLALANDLQKGGELTAKGADLRSCRSGSSSSASSPPTRPDSDLRGQRVRRRRQDPGRLDIRDRRGGRPGLREGG